MPCGVGGAGVNVAAGGLVGGGFVGGIDVFVGANVNVGRTTVGAGCVGCGCVGGAWVGAPAIAVAVNEGLDALQGSRSLLSMIPSLSESGVRGRGQVWFS